MGTSRAVTFSVHYVVDHGMWTSGEWRTRPRHQIPADGKPTTENLKEHCLHYEASTAPNGVNSHIGETKILKAWIVDERTGSTVATYERVGS